MLLLYLHKFHDLCLGGVGLGYMHVHLVSVEIGIVRVTGRQIQPEGRIIQHLREERREGEGKRDGEERVRETGKREKRRGEDKIYNDLLSLYVP